MAEILSRCPSCGSPIQAVRLTCPACQISVEGHFDLCPMCRMSPDQRRFVLTFLRCRGNIREVEREMGISYPTVRGRLEEILRALGANVESCGASRPEGGVDDAGAFAEAPTPMPGPPHPPPGPPCGGPYPHHPPGPSHPGPPYHGPHLGYMGGPPGPHPFGPHAGPPGPGGGPSPPPGSHGGPPPPPPPGWGPPGPPPPPGLWMPPWGDPPGAHPFRDLGPRRGRRAARAVASGAGVVVSVQGTEGAQARQVNVDEGRLPARVTDEVRVEQLFGSLTIVGSESADVHWTMRCEGDDADAVRLEALRGEDGLRLRVGVDEPGPEPGSREVSLRLEVPRGVSLRCDMANGPLAVTGMRNRVRLDSSNGLVRLEEHEGDYEVTALNGPVEIRAARGEGSVRVNNGPCEAGDCFGRLFIRSGHGSVRVGRGGGRLRVEVDAGDAHVTEWDGVIKIETSVGGVVLHDVRGSAITARSLTTGDVQARLAELPAEARLDLRAATGSVRVQLPRDCRARVHLHTGSGRLQCDLPLEGLQRTTHSVTGVVNAPEARVQLATLLGDVTVAASA